MQWEISFILLVNLSLILADISEQFCHVPSFTPRLPIQMRQKVESIWKSYKKGDDCHMQIARTRNLLFSLSPHERGQLLAGKRVCQLPAIVGNLPAKVQKRIVEIWQRRDPNGDCREQQRKTRLILLNLPNHLRKTLTPSPFQCAAPHFVYRLERELQNKILGIWEGYREGTPCHDRIDAQLQILQQNDISIESFHMPPADVIARLELLEKFRRANFEVGGLRTYQGRSGIDIERRRARMVHRGTA